MKRIVPVLIIGSACVIIPFLFAMAVIDPHEYHQTAPVKVQVYGVPKDPTLSVYLEGNNLVIAVDNTSQKRYIAKSKFPGFSVVRDTVMGDVKKSPEYLALGKSLVSAIDQKLTAIRQRDSIAAVNEFNQEQMSKLIKQYKILRDESRKWKPVTIMVRDSL